MEDPFLLWWLLIAVAASMRRNKQPMRPVHQGHALWAGMLVVGVILIWRCSSRH